MVRDSKVVFSRTFNLLNQSKGELRHVKEIILPYNYDNRVFFSEFIFICRRRQS